jgi:transposase
MRALRYFLAGFETLVALFFFCLFAGGLIATVQLAVQRTPLEGARRVVVVAELGRAMVVSVMGGVFAFWMARCAVRNFRDAKAKAGCVIPGKT